jgi:hypothetical protein
MRYEVWKSAYIFYTTIIVCTNNPSILDWWPGKTSTISPSKNIYTKTQTKAQIWWCST